jgi:hypothetical protein
VVAKSAPLPNSPSSPKPVRKRKHVQSILDYRSRE